MTLFYLVFGPLGVYVAIAPGNGRPQDVVDLFLAPIGASAIAFGIPRLALQLLRRPVNDWLELLLVSAVAAPIYILLIRWWMGSDVQELVSRLAALRFKVWRRSKGGV